MAGRRLMSLLTVIEVVSVERNSLILNSTHDARAISY
jgi:hypothetical protein